MKIRRLSSSRPIVLSFISAVLLTMTNHAHATTYYVSARGDDAADGRTPSTSWLTIEKLNQTKFAAGDAILFKRGDAWRGGQALYASSNGARGHPITFGAYGEGPKPLILGSKDVSAAENWVKYTDNIWRTASQINLTLLDGRARRTPDVANLIFDDEARIGVKKRFVEDLKNQGDFCLNLSDTLLYIYSVGNPASVYNKIEATGIRNCENNIEVKNGHYLVFSNLDIRYSKNNGLFLQDCSDIVIADCNFDWIGGCYFPLQSFMLSPRRNPARMGNGVQIWRGNANVTVEYCTFDHIYDAGISPQGGDANVKAPDYTIENLRFHHNLLKNCYMSFEFWGHQANSIGRKIYFENNTCINAGGSWSTAQRPDKGHADHLSFSTSKMAFSDIFIRNNIFYESVDFCSIGKAESKGSGTDAEWTGFTIDYNCYYMASKEKPMIKWRGGAAQGGGDYSMGDLKAYQAKTGKERHTIFADPQLTPAYALTPGSPALGAGLDVGYPFSGPRPDLGAFDRTGAFPRRR